MVKINFSIELPDSKSSCVKTDFDGLGIGPVKLDSSFDSSYKIMSQPYPKLVLCRNDVNTIFNGLQILESKLKEKQIRLYPDLIRVKALLVEFLEECCSSDK